MYHDQLNAFLINHKRAWYHIHSSLGDNASKYYIWLSTLTQPCILYVKKVIHLGLLYRQGSYTDNV